MTPAEAESSIPPGPEGTSRWTTPKPQCTSTLVRERRALPNDLLAVLAAVTDPEGVDRLLTDLLSPAELSALSERWAIVTELAAGRSQREVKASVGAAIATVSRGAQQLRDGHGGFALAFRTLRDLGLPHPPMPEPPMPEPPMPEEP